MTDEKISELYEKANGWSPTGSERTIEELRRFAEAVREEMALDGIHTCHDQCQRPVCVAIREAVAREREACIRDCDSVDVIGADDCIAAIRARGRS